MKRLIIKEEVILTDMALAEALALATSADCYHEDESLNWDASNGWPAYDHLTGRVMLENDVHQGAFVEMACPKCGKTSWVGDGDFFEVCEILVHDDGAYDIQYLEFED